MDQRTVDFIIVGAGSAGAALANRLTENGRFRVLLLEAGGKTHRLSQVPISFASFINRPGVNWLYASEPEDNTGGRAIPVPRGRMLGGSSAINGMVWVRGQRQDYDHWAQLGNRGWSYQDVLPIFRSMESYAGGANEIRGRAGPLKITDSDESGRLYDSFFAAAESIGIKRTHDYNGLDQDGIAMTQASISGGRRMSTAECYLDPARKRANLTIETDAIVESLVFEGRRCTGVRYSSRNSKREARAAREVIVAAGSIASPQLLELSGIGQGSRPRHRGSPRSARRGREPAGPLGAADEMARRTAWGHLQRARTRLWGAVARATLHDDAKRVPEPPGVSDACLLQDARRPRQPGRHVHDAALPVDAEREAG